METPLEKFIAPLGLVPDAGAKTEAYYSRNATPTIGSGLVAALKARLLQADASTVRICLHTDPSENLHQMLIVHRRGGRFPRHMHREKDESYHMIEGILRIEICDENGLLEKTIRVGGPDTGLDFLTRIRKGIWHATIPESDFAVFHESRPGPFEGGDSVFADQEKP